MRVRGARLRLRLVTSQGPPYPSRSPPAHPSGWTRTQGLSLLASMSLALAFAAARLAAAHTLCAATGLDSWRLEDDASDLEEASSQDSCTSSPQESTQLKTPTSLAVQARAPYGRGRRAKTSRAQTRRYENTPQY